MCRSQQFFKNFAVRIIIHSFETISTPIAQISVVIYNCNRGFPRFASFSLSFLLETPQAGLVPRSAVFSYYSRINCLISALCLRRYKTIIQSFEQCLASYPHTKSTAPPGGTIYKIWYVGRTRRPPVQPGRYSNGSTGLPFSKTSKCRWLGSDASSSALLPT